MIQLSTLAGPGIPTMPPQGSPFSGASGFAIALADLVGAAVEPIAGGRQPVADGGTILPGVAATPPAGDPLAVVALMTGAATAVPGLAAGGAAPAMVSVARPPEAQTIIVAAPPAVADAATTPVKPLGSAMIFPAPAGPAPEADVAPTIPADESEAGDDPAERPARPGERETDAAAAPAGVVAAAPAPVVMPGQVAAPAAANEPVAGDAATASTAPAPVAAPQPVARATSAVPALRRADPVGPAVTPPPARDVAVPIPPVSTAASAVRPGSRAVAPALPAAPGIVAPGGTVTAQAIRVQQAPRAPAVTISGATTPLAVPAPGQPSTRFGAVSIDPAAPRADPRGMPAFTLPGVMAAAAGPRPARFAGSLSTPAIPPSPAVSMDASLPAPIPQIVIDVTARPGAPSSDPALPLPTPSLPAAASAPGTPLAPVPDTASASVLAPAADLAPRVAAVPVGSQPEARGPVADAAPAQPVAASSPQAGVAPPVREATVAPDVPLPAPQAREQRVERQPVTVTVAPPVPAPVLAQPASQPAAQAFAAAMFAATERPERDRRESSDPLPAIAALSATAPAGAPAPVAATGPAAPLDLTRADWMQTMIDRIETLRSEGGRTETRLRLSPDALGSVDVTIRQDADGTMRIQVTAESPHARAILADAAPRLAEMAESRGLRMGGGGADAQAGTQQGQRDTPRAALLPQRPASAAETPDDPTSTDSRIA
jgi:hypothetical protein